MNNIKSEFKVELPDGEYSGEMEGYQVTIVDGPITTYFRANIGIKSPFPHPCKAVIENGFAKITLQ